MKCDCTKRCEPWPPNVNEVIVVAFLSGVICASIGFSFGWITYSYLEEQNYDEFTHGLACSFPLGFLGTVAGAAAFVGGAYIKSRRWHRQEPVD